MTKLRLSPAVRDSIVAHARDGAPLEVCGVLGGQGVSADGHRRVSTPYPAANVASTPQTRYEIDPETQYAIFTRLEACGEEIVGFYHSHPRGPAEPSATDAALATWPGRSYVIVSLEGEVPTLGSWRWCDTGLAGGAESGPEAGVGTEAVTQVETKSKADGAEDESEQFERERLIFE